MSATPGHHLDDGTGHHHPQHPPVRQFWEEAEACFAHIDYSEHLKSEDSVVARWKEEWLDDFAAGGWLEGARVGDFGIGAGLLGEVLYRDYGVAHYVGMDVAQRQLDATRLRLESSKVCPAQCTAALILVDEAANGDVAFLGAHNLDALVSQAVIMHFPSESYTATWLCSLAALRIPRLMLQVRHADPVVFNEWTHVENAHSGHVITATWLNCDYMATMLRGYDLVHAAASGGGIWDSRFDACFYQLSSSRGAPD